jgi:hypothetical protein
MLDALQYKRAVPVLSQKSHIFPGVIGAENTLHPLSRRLRDVFFSFRASLFLKLGTEYGVCEAKFRSNPGKKG